MKNKDIIFFNNQLLNWFKTNKRDLIFRKEKDPYRILVSEIMAQQTQIKTMLPYYNRFIKKFPTIYDLAQSNLEDVLNLWEGLGYYTRARNLWKTANIITENKNFPEKYDDLIKLPGIGPYTAGAIASIAFNQKIPALDGNALRVFSRLYGITEDISETETKRKINDLILKHLNLTDQPGNFNEAIMEIGALVCLKTNPYCKVCPVKKFCYAYLKDKISFFPVNKKRLKKVIESYDVLIMIYQNHPLFTKREKSGLLSGLYGFPMIQNNEHPGSTINTLKDKYNLKLLNYIGESKHVFTHKIWKSTLFSAETDSIPDDFTITPKSVPTAFKKMVLELNK